jgi:dihydropteroate synthase
MRIVPVLGALASEALWTMKIAHDRKREEEDHAALESGVTASM